MPKTGDYNKWLLKNLKKPHEAAAYLSALLEERDAKLFLKGLKKVAEARGGMSRLAVQTRTSRAGLYKAFSRNGNPELKTIGKILHKLNLRLAIKPLVSKSSR